MKDLQKTYLSLLEDPLRFAQAASGISLRAYQVEVALAILDSVRRGLGLSFVVMFPRQSGKNELQAQLEAYLLLLLSQTDVEMVKVSPTWKPQAQNAMRGLERTLSANLLTSDLWKKESGYIYRVGWARIFFFSGNPETNIVGATASTLLDVDEAQEVLPEKFDKDIAQWLPRLMPPESFSVQPGSATPFWRVSCVRPAFVLTAENVGAVLPSYRAFVDDQVARLGRSHPMVCTQFFSEEIEAGGGLFLPERRRLMRGDHPPQDAPLVGEAYAFLIDVGGEDAAGAALAGEVLQHQGGAITKYAHLQRRQ